MSRVRVAAVIVLLITVVSCGALLFLVQAAYNSLTGVGEQANAFMLALREDRPADAYALLDASVQAMVSEGAFREQVGGVRPTDWRFSSFNVRNDRGFVSGTLTRGETQTPLSIDLLWGDGRWTITRYAFE